MRIGIVWYGGYPYERNIDMLSQALLDCGAKPIIIASSYRTKIKSKAFNNIPIYYVPLNSLSASKLNTLKSYHFPFNWYWKNVIKTIADIKPLQAIIVRESPLSYIGISAAKEMGIPVYLDMRENLAEGYNMIKTNFFRNPIKYLLRHPLLVHAYEKFTLPKFNHIITVSEELKEWATYAYNVPKNRITPLENTPSLHFLKEAKLALQEIKRPSDVIRLVYAGNIEKHKGFGNIIEALPYIVKKEPCVKVRIIGEGNGLKIIKNRIKELNLYKYVEFFPMLGLREYARTLAECHVGLETCPLNQLTNQTIPGKIFEYMALGIPVLSSARKPVCRILKESKAGRVYEDTAPLSLAETVFEMIEKRSELFEMSKSAHAAILDKYSWENKLNVVKKAFGEIF